MVFKLIAGILGLVSGGRKEILAFCLKGEKIQIHVDTRTGSGRIYKQLYYKIANTKYCKGELWIFLCLRQQREPVPKLQEDRSQSRLQCPAKLRRERGGSLGL